MIRVEILYPDAANLYGDLQNMYYLQRSCPDIEIVEDNLWSEPHFLTQTPDLIYMGSMTEQGQRLIIENLCPYREKLEQMIADGVHFLITGNALEVFGLKITDADGTNVKALNLLPITTGRNMHKRYNALYLGSFETKEASMQIVGFKSQFGHSYWQTDEISGWFTTKRGDGLNPDIKPEGIRTNNFMATYLIGPLLITNPPLAKWLLRELGVQNPKLAYESTAVSAYNARIREFSDPNLGVYMGAFWTPPDV